MKLSDKKSAKMFKDYSDEALACSLHYCEIRLVKTGARKGQMTMQAIRFADDIQNEMNRRSHLRHATAVAALVAQYDNDEARLAALNSYFVTNGDTESYDAIAAINSKIILI
jgi:hypothetical protein